MGIMTLKAVRISFWIFDSFLAVQALIQIVHDIVMARETSVHRKKICQFLVDISRVWMEPLLSNVFMAVLTGGLAMGGDMKSSGINQPRGLGFDTTQGDARQHQYHCCYAFHEYIVKF